MLKFIQYLKLHPRVYKGLRAAAIVGGLLLAAVLYVLVVGISIDASGQQARLAEKLGQSMGREVRFDGAMQLEISARPKLKVGGLHIANAKGFAGADLVSLGEARLALDLWPLLRLRFQIEELAGSAVQIHLQLKKDGSNNWTFKPAAAKQANVKQDDPEQAGDISLAKVLARLDIKRVSLDQLNVELIAANAKRHFFELESLQASLPAGEPVTLALRGKIEKTHPYRLDFSGGSISDLDEQRKPWPVDLKLDFMNSRLLLNGVMTENDAAFDFALGTQDLAEFEQLLQSPLPAVGAVNVSGALKFVPGQVSLENLSGIMGKTTLQGGLTFLYGGERPRVEGELALPILDLRPFMTGKPVDDEAPPRQLSQIYREISAATFNLKGLNELDADLTLRVGHWLSMPGDVHDAMLKVKLEQGRLTMPMQIQMADVKLAGSASADARTKPARFKLKLEARDSSLGNLGGLLMGLPDVQGHLDRFDLTMAARGDRGAELMQSLNVQMNVIGGEMSYGHAEGERPVNFTLDKLALDLPAGKPLSGNLQGAMLDKRFSATLRGAPLTSLMTELIAPVDFDLQAGSARVQVHALLQNDAQQSKSDVNFKLNAPHSDEIASWLGLKSGADAPVNAQGKFHTDSSGWHLQDFTLKLGRSDVALDVQQLLENNRSLIRLQLTSDLLDVEQMQSLLPEAKKPAADKTPVATNMMDIPILPSGINLAEADIAVRLKRITSSAAFAVRDVNFDGKIRDGMMPISPFSANVADNNFSGAMSLDLRTQQPHAVFWVAADKLDIGSVLKKIGVTSNLEAAFEHASFQLDLHSSHLGDLLAQSELLANFDGGQFTLTDANSGGKMRIALDQGELKSGVDEPVYLKLNGAFEREPVQINIQTAKAADLINPKLSLPFTFKASTSGASIKLSGDIERPFSNKGLSLALEMQGSRFDNLNTLARTSLPPWGPWSAAGKFNMSAAGYAVSDLNLRVGGSQLTGFGNFDTRAVPPRLDITLSAPTIQLDDFRLGNWTLEKSGAENHAAPVSKEEFSRKANTASQQAQQILSPEVLGRQNAYLKVQVDQVISGADKLGSGKLEAKLENGRAVLGPVLVNTPGGSASFQMNYEPGKNDVAVSLRAEAKHFDYGVLARRLDHKSEMRGVFSLDVDVSGRTQYLADIFKSGKGHVDFAVWPENMKSGLLDIWAVNLLMSILPAVDKSNESKVNCAVGRFQLVDGNLTEKSFLIDTSRMRVTGKGGVNFASGNVQLYVKPHAKTPQFLSLAIPIEVSGTIDDYSVGVRALDMVETLGEMYTSVVLVPLKMLFGKETPADGRDVCSKTALE